MQPNILITLLFVNILLFNLSECERREPVKLTSHIIAGYYSYHPAYENESPYEKKRLNGMPFGLPMGGFESDGRPYGFIEYLLKGDPYAHHILLEDYKNKLRKYHLYQLNTLSLNYNLI